jgi:hypothetical protein
MLEGNKTEVGSTSSWDGTSGYIQFTGTGNITYTVGDPVHSGTMLIFHKEDDNGTATVQFTNDYNADYPDLSLVEQDQVAMVMYNKDVGGWIVMSNEVLGSDAGSFTTINVTNVVTLGRSTEATQTGSRTTAVSQTQQDPVFLITTHNASLANGASATFTVNNGNIDDNDVLIGTCINEANIDVYITNVVTDAYDITITNRTGSATTTAHQLRIIRIN